MSTSTVKICVVGPQEGGKTGAKDWSNIKDGDVVILPAFGASLSEMQLLEQKNARIVDTTFFLDDSGDRGGVAVDISAHRRPCGDGEIGNECHELGSLPRVLTMLPPTAGNAPCRR